MDEIIEAAAKAIAGKCYEYASRDPLSVQQGFASDWKWNRMEEDRQEQCRIYARVVLDVYFSMVSK